MADLYDPRRPDVIADPCPAFRRLQDRDAAPLSEGLGGRVLTRFDDVKAALGDRACRQTVSRPSSSITRAPSGPPAPTRTPSPVWYRYDHSGAGAHAPRWTDGSRTVPRSGTVRARRAGMTMLLMALLAVSIVGVPDGGAHAQTDFGAGPGHWLKVDWQVAEQPGRAVVFGYVFNDFGLAARDVNLLVEGLDPAGRVTTRAYGRVPFVVAPGTRGYFETALAPASEYRVSVYSYTWMHDDDFRLFRRPF